MKEPITMEKLLKITYWRAIVIGPIAVLPTSILLLFISSTLTPEFETTKEIIGNSFFVSLWGISIAYIVVFTYGTFIWHLLLHLKLLSISYLLLASLIPPILLSLINTDIELILSTALYSLSVCWLSWFVGLRYLQKL
ncbi:MAG: hypothetical protein DIZ80_11780 [endosymbiont of Galathealinum brachiosum]|uniref:Yip1 domain-containing protein n=1 Tax=endosymbiont of Galathealinum brachiosum TaxID=2200906 RepID=A0A370DDE8_9GAMM|nr:MAG: hypothetical protein DIZ80_11780 [endosymbiont of Galathealinum brachiosum]